MLHEELKQARLSQGLSLRKLEELSCVGFNHIRKIEAGADASTSTINKICRALGLKLTIMNTGLNEIKQDINRVINELNESASKAWDDERILENAGLSVKKGKLELALFVGKCDKGLHIVSIAPDVWMFVKRDKRGANVVEEFMHNVVMPMLPPERIEEALNE